MGPYMKTQHQSEPPSEHTQYIPDSKVTLPSPSFRHAAPSAPWPWVDIDDEINDEQTKLMNGGAPPIPELCLHVGAACDNCWKNYPSSRFPNWTSSQVQKSKIEEAVNVTGTSVCYNLDVDVNGYFRNVDLMVVEAGQEATAWSQVLIAERPKESVTRAIFIENLSGPVLQMLGTKYNIEPFFFSSSLNWIPSRFQEDLKPKFGDHITITLTFLRSVSTQKMPDYKAVTRPFSGIGMHNGSKDTLASNKYGRPVSASFEDSIDTKAPLKLRYSERYLCLDLLSVHLIRNIEGNTIISYHPNLDLPTTTAAELHDRIRFAGQSVYWQKMFQESSDPTLLLLTFLWHALYSWDQALEHLYSHICQVESKVIESGRWKLTQDLHIIRAHQLFYTSLLRDLAKSVEFIRKTKNPAMNSDKPNETDKTLSLQFVERECDNIKTEIDRLINDLSMQEKRLRNVMNLVFSSVTITDSKLMRDMTEAAVRDSAAMKQIAYLTMVFLPATFVAGLFGMNVVEVEPGSKGTIGYYAAFAIPLTLCTIWVIIAFQSRYLLKERTFFQRLGWPWLLLKKFFQQGAKKEEKRRVVLDRTILDDYDEEKAIEQHGQCFFQCGECNKSVFT